MIKKIKLWICSVIGHNSYLDSANCTGPSTCRRCGFKNPGIEWPRE